MKKLSTRCMPYSKLGISHVISHSVFPGSDSLFCPCYKLTLKLSDLRSHAAVENGARILNPPCFLSPSAFFEEAS